MPMKYHVEFMTDLLQRLISFFFYSNDFFFFVIGTLRSYEELASLHSVLLHAVPLVVL